MRAGTGDPEAAAVLSEYARKNGLRLVDEDEGEPMPPHLSEDALAQEFTGRHRGDLRYIAAWGRWYRWTGNVWRADDTLAVFDLARAICRARAQEVKVTKERIAARLASAQTVAAVVKLAQSDRAHARPVGVWDASHWLLNTPECIVDLRSGERRPHDSELYLTKMTAVGPSDEDPGLWLRVLDRAFAGEREVIAYLQRLFGYGLTGSTREHIFGFWWGTGANSKGTILNTMSGILGDYATVAPMEAFTVAQGERHPTDMALLRGARLVTAQETEDGRRWAESRLKSLTGGDPITARFMRQDFFTFAPQFKLLIAGNHKPGLRTVDEAIRRRLHLVPFTVTIPPEERDTQLAEKLKAEWPAILGWAIRGCLAWQAAGLQPPDAVRTATNDYLRQEDSIGNWIEECCSTGSDAEATVKDLFESWVAWAKAAEEYVGRKKGFSQKLQDRGFQRAKVRAERGFRGVRVGR